jgi:hypothetical protein
MEALVGHFYNKLGATSTDFVRDTMHKVNWEARLIGIKGARGIGKTTLLLQYIKLHLADQLAQTLYVSLDAIWFNSNSLMDLVDDFSKKGGKHLFIDEVHKLQNWSQVLKNIYDAYPELKVVFTGSSLLEILNARADLSRRAVVYEMQGFSFREYLRMETGINFEILSLEQILSNHVHEAQKINQQIKPFQYFETYLKQGYYPYYQEQPDLYEIRLGEVINMILEIELPQLRGVELAYVTKVKQLLVIIAESVPFMPNVSKLSEKININRATLLSYLHYLSEIGLTRNLYKDAFGISRLQKPVKVYLDNTNLIHLLAKQNANIGNKRETFFINQISYQHRVSYIAATDFKVDDTYFFEIGGKHKTRKQIAALENSYVVADDIEYGFQNKIPLWLFGFMY